MGVYWRLETTTTPLDSGAEGDQSDVLHVDAANPAATIVGDLSQCGTLPPDSFDCIILTQTLQFIFDIRRALAEVADSLKPGEILLITVPGITPIDRGQWGYTWYWSLTEVALGKLLAECFDKKDFRVDTHWNVFAAVCFLEGLAVSEVQTSKLDIVYSRSP